YDWGMLNLAEHMLTEILDALRGEIRAGVPIVGLEPSCVSVFRDELLSLFPDDDDAQRLSKQTFLLSEFLEKKARDYRLPQLKRKAIVHGHCHHKSILGMGAESAVLQKLGLDYKILDSGCCGMAGAFGFEEGEHYDVSIKAGERVLLPAVREADPETLIITNGFSCREQIEQCTGRRPLHLAQVLHSAIRGGADSSGSDYKNNKEDNNG
ncbi:MAG: FAD-binding oxidoreductase, partial [Chloroflexi bacterium]|nr:FAD-binding oxidoreductase [Chloroflexota bacterium]